MSEPGSDVTAVNSLIIAETFRNFTSEQALEPNTVATIGRLLYEAFSVSLSEQDILATDQVRVHMWQAMGSRPSSNPAHLAAATLLEGAFPNWGNPKINLLAYDRIHAKSQRIVPGLPHLLVMQYPRQPAVMSAGVPTTSNFVVGLVDTPDGYRGRTGFAIGIEENRLTIKVGDAANSWLDEEGKLAPDSDTLSLFSGEAEILPFLKVRLERLIREISHLSKVRKEEGASITATRKRVLINTIIHHAHSLRPLIQATEQLDIKPSSVNLSNAWWDRLKRIVQAYDTPRR